MPALPDQQTDPCSGTQVPEQGSVCQRSKYALYILFAIFSAIRSFPRS